MVDDTAPESGQGTAPATAPEVALPADVEAALVDRDASQEVMSLLSEHVPLALLADLAIPEGPASPEILSEEGLPDVAWWEGGEASDAEDGAPAR
ncbi:hypothetical protein [Actinotalea sp. Marseille-Q4924]|uniref:hypothetical protein n=1 Tax=Actinotalea sp. Marseille-Q4924 TaxID=2866571 RepID=UPI001CE41474|nr:hypothetical protein [Actinotalea sp. Marseille-Q4924]